VTMRTKFEGLESCVVMQWARHMQSDKLVRSFISFYLSCA